MSDAVLPDLPRARSRQARPLPRFWCYLWLLLLNLFTLERLPMAQSETSTGASLRLEQPVNLNALDWLSLSLMVVGGINWGLIGALDLDLVAILLGPGTMASRIVYMLVGLGAVYGVILMTRLGRSATR